MFSEKIEENGIEIGKFNGSLWMKVFFHNCTGNIKFKDEQEALNCHEKQKYSILNKNNPKMKTRTNATTNKERKYEFILEYPNNNYIQWRQTNSPIHEEEIQGKMEATGFEIIHKIEASAAFGGLVKTKIESHEIYINSLLNGQPGSYLWGYAIGMYKETEPEYLNLDIPSYSSRTKLVSLWIKMNLLAKSWICTCRVFKKYPPIYPLFILLLIC